MSNYPALSTVRLRVLRSLFLQVRGLIIELGYLPDPQLFPQTPLGKEQYDNAVASIVAQRGFCIEIFGHSSPHKREVVKAPRIVIQLRSSLEGDIGGNDNWTNYIPVEGGYKRVRHPGRSENLLVDVKLISNTTHQDDLLHSIVAASIRQVGYIPIYDSPGDYFHIRTIAHRDNPNSIEGLLNYTYSMMIEDLYLSEPIIDELLISPILEIETTITNDTEILESDWKITVP